MELISIREFARRIGVSDTAVRKAISSKRVKVHSHDPKNARPLLKWPTCRDDWESNTNAAMRTHVGSREPDAVPAEHQLQVREAQEVAPAPKARKKPGPKPSGADDQPLDEDGMPSLNVSRAKREFYQAELARVDLEQRQGKLIEADGVRQHGRALGAALLSGFYTIPDRISDELAGMNDPNQIQALLIRELDQATENVRKSYGL